MCGLVGVVTSNDVGVCLYDTLTVLQHRGQDAAGIMTSDNGKLNLRKDNGLIKDVFRTRHMSRLIGQMGIGHVRYPTAGSSSPALAQPFYVNSPFGIEGTFAWYLFAAGIGLSYGALREGWISDDKYPGYGGQYRRYMYLFDSYAVFMRSGLPQV